jgi:hypothetical protein
MKFIREKVMDSATYEKALAALLCWREENGNGVNGMLGVLFCLRNRAKAGWEMGQWSKLITTHNQFSSMTVKGDAELVQFPDLHDQNFVKVLQMVDGIYDGTTEDTLTNGGLYYYDPGPGVTPGGWFDRVILGNPEEHPRCATIGHTQFFK